MAENPYMLTPEEQLLYAAQDPAHPFIDPQVVSTPAADAEREVEARRPALLVVRAELPDASGFTLCARLRREGAGGPPVLIVSPDGPALAEHARSPAAADGYLSLLLETEAPRRAARDLAGPEGVELADDAVIAEEGQAVEVRPGAGGPAAPSPDAAPVPPPVPQRPRRAVLTDEDRLFLDRVFHQGDPAKAASR